jgi:hypothetical protein
MNISKFHQHYRTHDGRIKSFHLDIENNVAEIELFVKRIITPGKGRISEEDLIPCTLKLTFRQLIEVSLFNRLPSDGYYLEFVTYNDNDSEVGLLINVFDNSSYVHEKPNWVIKAKRVSWEEV